MRLKLGLDVLYKAPIFSLITLHIWLILVSSNVIYLRFVLLLIIIVSLGIIYSSLSPLNITSPLAFSPCFLYTPCSLHLKSKNSPLAVSTNEDRNPFLKNTWLLIISRVITDTISFNILPSLLSKSLFIFLNILSLISCSVWISNIKTHLKI